ncbi:hypothetical protein HanLR1_Chr08g0275721 [Helianthus annuus]|nr:hypothetical protein HanLR1_Chr08g0275721 [Helianthus annuus]
MSFRLLFLFGGYLITAAAYRFFYLGIRRIDNLFMSLVRRFRGPSQNYSSSYSPVDF